MQENTVATKPKGRITEAPAGFIAEADVLRIAMEEGKKRGWCGELKDVLLEQFGIVVPERPDNLALRVTIDIPADLVDYNTGKDFWVKWDVATPDEVSLSTEDYAYGVTTAEWAMLQAFNILRRRTDDSWGDQHTEAVKVVKSAKIELVRTEAAPATPDE